MNESSCCGQCGHEWKPKICPRCKSKKWDGVKVEYDRSKNFRGARGKRTLYKVSDMKPGDSKFFPWPKDAAGLKDLDRCRKMSNAIRQSMYYHEWALHVTPTPKGLHVRRVEWNKPDNQVI